jgi:hypothetical protein
MGKRGALGAEITVRDPKGRLVARRTTGSQMLTGCCGPNTVNLAIRHPGTYRLSVRFSDGAIRTWPVDLTEQKRATIKAKYSP